jgi:adenosylcobinamide-GDP ribazoletransferase
VNGLLLGVAFLTRLPLPVGTLAPGDWARAVRWFPLAGAFVAMVGVLALTAGSWLVSPLVGAVASVAAMVWATGGLHVDGFSDCLDGIGVNGDAARRLEVMHDPRVGAVGAAGTALFLFLKIALLVACVESGTAAPAIWVACVLARAFLPLEIATGVPATPGKGLFARLAAEVGLADAALGAIVAGALVAPALLFDPTLGVALGAGIAAAAAATIAWQASWRARIGGLNGDVLGAAVEIREALLLAALAASWHG